MKLSYEPIVVKGGTGGVHVSPSPLAVEPTVVKGGVGVSSNPLAVEPIVVKGGIGGVLVGE